MDSQKFDPQIFINGVQGLCGILDPESLLFVHDFAVKIGDQSKLNKCLNHVNRLAYGLPRDIIWFIFFWIFTTYVYFHTGEYIKPIKAKIDHSRKKRRDSYLKKIKKAIDTLKALKPDPSRFDEDYLLNLADKKAAGWNLVLSLGNFEIINLIESIENFGVVIGTPTLKKKNPKGCDAINLFIYNIHATVKSHGSTLTDNAICNRIASLLTILTGNRYVRQDVEGFLKRKPQTL